MRLVKLTTPKRINKLRLKPTAASIGFIAFFSASFCATAIAQDNSPYSRYGIGDLVPATNITNRAMGGISTAVADAFSVNFNNPASYSLFQAFKEAKSSKLVSGRALLDVGLNIDNRTLRSGNTAEKFTAKNVLFSHVQLGIPLRKNWGMSFGIRPVSRISYRIGVDERLYDPNSGNPIDSAYTEYTGDGGAYLASGGTGFRLFTIKDKNKIEKISLNVGINGGYLFGKKNYNTRRSFYNDTVEYKWGNYESSTSYGNLFFNTGVMLRTTLNAKKATYLTIGAHGNWEQTLKAKQDIVRETFTYDETMGDIRLDSVSDQRGIAGDIIYPSSFTVGFAYERFPLIDKDFQQAGFLFSAELTQRNWNNYRFYGNADHLINTWELRTGAEIRPIPRRNFFSNVTYRVGFFTGPDYIKPEASDIKQTGFTAGIGVPISSNYAARQGQVSFLNIALEYIKRGNKENIVNENLFRLSFGLSFSDLWFRKRKYD